MQLVTLCCDELNWISTSIDQFVNAIY